MTETSEFFNRFESAQIKAEEFASKLSNEGLNIFTNTLTFMDVYDNPSTTDVVTDAFLHKVETSYVEEPEFYNNRSRHIDEKLRVVE